MSRHRQGSLCAAVAGLPFAHFADLVKNHFNSDAKVTCSEASQNILGQGYMSHILQLHLNWDADTNGKLPKSVIVKVPTHDNSNELLQAEEGTDAVTEQALTEEKGNVPIPLPQIYSVQKRNANTTGYLLMEDMSNNCAQGNFVDGLSLQHCREISTTLGQLHAYCLMNDSWKADPDLNFSFHKFNIGTKAMDNAVKQGSEALCKVYPETFNPIVERLFREVWVGDTVEFLRQGIAMNEIVKLPDVLCHGDLWMSNMLIEREGEKQIKAWVDWQFSHPGCPVEDFIRCFMVCASPEALINHLKELLAHYYQTLSTALATANRPVPFTFDQLLNAYGRMLPFGAAISVMHNGILLCNDKFVGNEDGQLGERQRVLAARAQKAAEDCFSYLDGKWTF